MVQVLASLQASLAEIVSSRPPLLQAVRLANWLPAMERNVSQIYLSSVCLSVRPSVCPSVHLSIHLPGVSDRLTL